MSFEKERKEAGRKESEAKMRELTRTETRTEQEESESFNCQQHTADVQQEEWRDFLLQNNQQEKWITSEDLELRKVFQCFNFSLVNTRKLPVVCIFTLKTYFHKKQSKSILGVFYSAWLWQRNQFWVETEILLRMVERDLQSV